MFESQERVGARRSFEADAALIRWELLTLHDDPNARRPVLLARSDWTPIAELPRIDARLTPVTTVYDSDDPRDDLPPGTQARLERWGTNWRTTWSTTAPVILFHGRYGTGKRAASRTAGLSHGSAGLILSALDLASKGLNRELVMKLAERECILTNALMCWEDADIYLLPQTNSEVEHRAFVQAISQSLVPTILLTAKAWEPAHELGERPFLRLELPEPTYAERRAMWISCLGDSVTELSDADLVSLTGRFRLTTGQIRDAVARAQTLAWVRDPAYGHITPADIDMACRNQAQHRLGALARKLNPRYSWDDIVLPRLQLSTLKMICTTIRQRPVVYGDWGFDKKLSLGKGLIALFAGPSGTGKTMAAEIIANDLGQDVYKIDLSSVVSKYIGETEKNLEKIFSEAQDTDAILFFDEADALFGKRSEVKDAHDRYANIETAYLLQRTEEYNGLVILASNIKKNMDEAFVRRLHFMVDFPFPEEPERVEIWRRTFPLEAPRDPDIDLEFLARKFKITGGNIRNIILAAAFIAADDRKPIAMRHLVRGASYEFQKMGKLVVQSDFEHYFEMTRAE